MILGSIVLVSDLQICAIVCLMQL